MRVDLIWVKPNGNTYTCATDESVPVPAPVRVSRFRSFSRDNQTSTSVKVVPLSVMSEEKICQQITVQFGCATAGKLAENYWKLPETAGKLRLQ